MLIIVKIRLTAWSLREAQGATTSARSSNKLFLNVFLVAKMYVRNFRTGLRAAAILAIFIDSTEESGDVLFMGFLLRIPKIPSFHAFLRTCMSDMNANVRECARMCGNVRLVGTRMCVDHL